MDFKSGKLRFLVATGVASRGIDIDALTRVVNYDLPDEADDYIHRIGRTGRAGACGEAISFVSKDDFRNLCAIERRLGHLIVRKEIEGFVPNKEVPVSILDFVPKNTTPKTFKARAPEARSSRPAKEGSFETAHAKKHRSAKSKPEVKANVTRPQSIQTDNDNDTTGRSAPFNPWNSGPKTK